MEVDGSPPPSVIRSLILNLKMTQPVVFRKIHKNWIPVSWDLEKFNEVLCVEGQLFPCRVGKIRNHHQEPQWDSQTRIKLLSWDAMMDWSSLDEWIYFDYKDMRDVVKENYLQDFEWSLLGFPEMSGNVSNLWIGSPGSYTACHYDTYGSNLVTQVKGRKRWLMFPPEASCMQPTRIPYEESSVYSKINFCRPPSSVIQELDKAHGMIVTLEPGDVLFVPPKWWHYVQSEDFSISVNTWIEMKNDAEMRVEEAIMRALLASFVSVCSPETAVHLLNPNEEDLLDASENQIDEFLHSATADLFRGEAESDNQADQPMTKKARLNSTEASLLISSSLAEILRKECSNVKSITPFEASIFYAGQSDDAIISKSVPTSYFDHLINAIGHPDVMKIVRTKFLENVRSYHHE